MALIDDILAAALPGPLKDNFGDPVTYVHKPSGTSATVTAMLSDPSPEESAFPGKTVIAEILRADLSIEPIEGDEVTIGSDVYFCFDVKSDSVGPSGLFRSVYLRKK